MLRIKIICYTLTKWKKHCATLKKKFIERGYEENILQDQIDKVDSISRKDLLRKNIKDRIPCLIIYNRELPMMRKIINKHWNVFEINPELQETFQSNGFVAFKKKQKLTRNYRRPCDQKWESISSPFKTQKKKM